MAATSQSLQSLVAAAFGEPGDASNAARERILEIVADSVVSLLHLVQALQAQLTTTDNAVRANATRLLADVASRARCLADGDLHHLAEFFASRLSDWPCLEAAAAGAEALLARSAAKGAASFVFFPYCWWLG